MAERIIDLLRAYEEEIQNGEGVTFQEFLQNMERRKPNPEESRTQEFFEQGVSALTRGLRGLTIQVDGSNKSIQLTNLEPWTFSKVGKRYEEMEEMDAGDLWAVPFPFRKMTQSLIVAKDRGQIGACVRIIRAASFDPKTGDYVEMPREGDTAKYLGLKDGEVAKLMFLDKSDTLHLVRQGRR